MKMTTHFVQYRFGRKHVEESFETNALVKQIMQISYEDME